MYIKMQKKINISYFEFYEYNVDNHINNYCDDNNIKNQYISKIFTILKKIYYYDFLNKINSKVNDNNNNNNDNNNDNNNNNDNDLAILQLNSDLEAVIEDYENCLYDTENPQFDLPQKVYNFRIDMINYFKNYLENFISINYL